MKLHIELDLDGIPTDQEGLDQIATALVNLCNRLPLPLTETNGDLILHDAWERYLGKARIDQKTFWLG